MAIYPAPFGHVELPDEDDLDRRRADWPWPDGIRVRRQGWPRHEGRRR